MSVSIKDVKRLKELTGVGITDAKKALEESKGDFDAAVEAMRVKGMAKADKKSEREARAGLVDSYLHSERIGVLVEVNCETDFVARTDDFKDFVHNIAMHIAAAAPTYITPDDVTDEAIKKEKKLIEEELKEQGKPLDMLDKIMEGKLNKFYEEVCLMKQAYIKDPDQKIEDYLKETVAKLGENIVIRQMARIELGGN